MWQGGRRDTVGLEVIFMTVFVVENIVSDQYIHFRNHKCCTADYGEFG